MAEAAATTLHSRAMPATAPSHQSPPLVTRSSKTGPVPPPKPASLSPTTNGTIELTTASTRAAATNGTTPVVPPPRLKPLSAGGGGGGAGGGAGGGGDEVNWKERCHTLEASLHKFKQQATRIRELLSQKVSFVSSLKGIYARFPLAGIE